MDEFFAILYKIKEEEDTNWNGTVLFVNGERFFLNDFVEIDVRQQRLGYLNYIAPLPHFCNKSFKYTSNLMKETTNYECLKYRLESFDFEKSINRARKPSFFFAIFTGKVTGNVKWST